MKKQSFITLGLVSLLSISSGMMVGSFGPFYIQLQTATNQVVNLLIEEIPLAFVNEGFQPVYVNGEFSSLQNQTTCTVTFPTATTVQLKFTNISQFGPHYPGPIHMHTYPLMSANNQLLNSNEITLVSVGLPAGAQQGTIQGNKFPVTETAPLFRYL